MYVCFTRRYSRHCLVTALPCTTDTALSYTTLHYTTLYYTVLRYATPHYTILPQH